MPFLHYAIARFNEEQRTMAYRVYMTDSIQMVNQNSHLRDRWIDTINRKVDNRTGDEVAQDVIKKAGLHLG